MLKYYPALFLLVSLFLTGTATAQQNYLPYELGMKKASSEGRDLPRTIFTVYSTRDEALREENADSLSYRPLNGTWKFRHFASPSVSVREMADSLFDDSAWQEVTVPHNWTGDRKSETNAGVGVYRRQFIIPNIWDFKDIFLHIGAADKATVIYVNGHKVGFNKDSRNPSEYDITRYSQEGVNQIAVFCYEWSNEAALEEQEVPQRFGLLNDCYIFMQPKIRIRSYVVEPKLSTDRTKGSLQFGVILKSNLLNERESRLIYEVIDGSNGKLLARETKNVLQRLRSEDTIYFNTFIPDVKKWSPEEPNLYSVVITLLYENRITEIVHVKAAFRELLLQDKRLVLNGSPIKLKGVTVRNFGTAEGASSREQMEHELMQMKRMGINAVRVGDYPMPDAFYDLCDRIGLLVADQANIDARRSDRSLRRGESMANDPVWEESYKARAINAYERNKNHPSVILFSYAGEGSNGYNLYETYLALKKREKQRPVVYAGAWNDWNSDIQLIKEASLKDVVQLEGEPSDRPYLIWSMNHRMEESKSSILKAWELIENSDKLLGGFFLEWTDAKRMSETPELQGQPFGNIRFTYHETDKTVEIANRFDHLPLSAFDTEYEIINAAGKTVAKGMLTLTAAAGASERIPIDRGSLTERAAADRKAMLEQRKAEEGNRFINALKNIGSKSTDSKAPAKEDYAPGKEGEELLQGGERIVFYIRSKGDIPPYRKGDIISVQYFVIK